MKPASPTGRDLALVVDDSPESLSVLIDAIEEGGFSALVARTGLAALELLERVTPDVILLDARMPGIDGFETCRRLKDRPETAETPVIFITGLTDSLSVLEGLQAGGVDYVAKPINPEEVIARISVHVANARLLRDARGALDLAGKSVAAFRPDGALAWISPQAGRLLDAALDAAPEGRGALVDWARRMGMRAASEGSDLQMGSGESGIRLSMIGRTVSGHLLARLAPDDGAPPWHRVGRALGVTPREAEVLYWLSQGKANRDIAEILRLSPRTVMKHIEQILFKVNAENRTAAASLCLRILMQ